MSLFDLLFVFLWITLGYFILKHVFDNHEPVHNDINKEKISRRPSNIDFSFNIKPRMEFSLKPVKEKQLPVLVENLSTSDILYWAKKYEADHPWWNEKEQEIGDKIRILQYLDRDLLEEIVHWKFKDLPGRETITLNRLSIHTNEEIIEITRTGLAEKTIEARIRTLRKLN